MQPAKCRAFTCSQSKLWLMPGYRLSIFTSSHWHACSKAGSPGEPVAVRLIDEVQHNASPGLWRGRKEVGHQRCPVADEALRIHFRTLRCGVQHYLTHCKVLTLFQRLQSTGFTQM